MSLHDRLAENQPMAGFSSLNEHENGMGKSESELLTTQFPISLSPPASVWIFSQKSYRWMINDY